MDEAYDIVIAGGGPVGAALAIALSHSGYTCALCEARPANTATYDGRTIALSHGSRLVLDRLGVWPALEQAATAISHIEVSQRGGVARVQLRAKELEVPALGYVIPYAVLRSVLARALAKAPARVLNDNPVRQVKGDAGGASVMVDAGIPLRARLVVIADGGSPLNISHVRTQDYHQSALICNVASEQSHQNRAYERFMRGGVLALLPSGHGWSIVWTLRPPHAQELAALNEAEFCGRLLETFGRVLGAFNMTSERHVFPLALRYATRPVAPRTVLIGNAAQILHPVAGQGLNLGLRDAWELARALVTNGRRDPGGNDFVNAYFSQRRFDRIATILFTDSLIQLFCKDIPLLNSARGLGLAAFSAAPTVKNFLARRMMFGARG